MSKTFYSRGNLEKYQTKNPFKRMCVEAFRKKIQYIVRSLNLENKTEVLDMGCGEGFVSRLLAAVLPEATIIGIDINQTALDLAKQMCSGIYFYQEDIYLNSKEDNRFDLVICTEVLEHLENPDAALQELMRVSKRYILITVPEEPYFCLGNFLTGKNLLRIGNPSDHLHLWNKSNFMRFLNKNIEATGFNINKNIRIFPWQCWILEKNHV